MSRLVHPNPFSLSLGRPAGSWLGGCAAKIAGGLKMGVRKYPGGICTRVLAGLAANQRRTVLEKTAGRVGKWVMP